MYTYLILIFTFIFLVSCSDNSTLSDAYGNFETTPVTVSAETNGKLLFLKVEEGQWLKAGEAIALVDTTQLHLQRNLLYASLNALNRQLKNTTADIGVLKNKKNNLTRERDRVKRLAAKKAATTQQLDDLNGKIAVVAQQIVALRAQTKTGNSAILAEREPLLAQIALVDEQIRKSYIKNPIAGTVLTKLAEAHETVGIGSPLYRIGQLDTMIVRFYVDAVQLQQLKVGQQIQVLIDSGKEDLKALNGVLSWIAEQAEFTPKVIQTKEDRVNLVYAIKARVPNVEGRIKIGMPAEVNFVRKATNE